MKIVVQPDQHPEIKRKPRILSFCRPYLVADYRMNVAPIMGEFDFEFLTDGHVPGTRDTRARFYAALRRKQRCPDLDPTTEADVLARCRLLRNLPVATARDLVHAMAHVLVDELDTVQPQAIVCQQVDEYVTHLLSLLARRRGIRYVGYAFSYFPGFVQLMQQAHGESIRVREPSDAEVDQVLGTISQRVFRQSYAQVGNYTLARHLRGLVRYRVKQIVFAAKKLLERDPWNLHYTITPYIVERRRLRDFPRPTDFSTDWSQELQIRRARSGRRVVYMPLGYFPEATVDYWVRDTRILQYEDMNIDIVRALARSFIVVVKEHIHMMGGRDTAFYRRLRDEPGVVSVHPAEYSNDVLAAADAVVVGAGSVGIEATIRGKPVLSYCDSSYWFGASRARALLLQELDSWPEQVTATIDSHRPLVQTEIREFLRECMRTTVRSRPGGRRWPLIEVQDLRELLYAAVDNRPEWDIRAQDTRRGAAC